MRLDRFTAQGHRVRHILRVASEPARRFLLLWYFVGTGISVLYIIIGAGYAVAGTGATASNTLRLLYNILRPVGGYHAHGVIMIALSLCLSYGLGHYSKFTRWMLIAVLFYSLLVAIMIFGGWMFYPLSFGAPFWYLFTAFLSGLLVVFAPPLDAEHGRVYRGGSGA